MRAEFRLIIVSSSFYPRVGGAERQALELARSLRQRRTPVVVLTLRSKLGSNAGAFCPVPVVRVPNPPIRFLGPALAYLRAAVATSRLARAHHSVVQLQTLDQFSLVVGLAALILGLPVVVRISGAYELNLGYLSARLGVRPLLARWLLRRSAGVIALNSEIEERLIALGVPPQRILSLPNAIPDAFFRVQARSRSERSRLGPLSVLYLGRIDRFKGCMNLMTAWREVQRSYPQARLHLVGDGPLRTTVEAAVNEHGLASTVTLWGTQPRPEEFYAEADLFVLPSEQEGMPNSLLEAMASGLPCISTSLPATRGLIDDGSSGVLCPPADPGALAEAICRLLSSEPRRVGLGQCARESVRERSTSALIERYLEVYRGLCDGSNIYEKTGGIKCAG